MGHYRIKVYLYDGEFNYLVLSSSHTQSLAVSRPSMLCRRSGGMQHVRPAEQATQRVSELVNLDFCCSLVEKNLSFCFTGGLAGCNAEEFR